MKPEKSEKLDRSCDSGELTRSEPIKSHPVGSSFTTASARVSGCLNVTAVNEVYV